MNAGKANENAEDYFLIEELVVTDGVLNPGMSDLWMLIF